LHTAHYTPAQIELSLANVYEVDTVLIDDGTFYVVEEDGEIVACGGWSKHATLCAGHTLARPADELLDPARDAAKIRAFFVRPSHARRGLASLLLERCEAEARAAGFRRAELGATLSGVPFYAARGYVATARSEVELSDTETLPVVLMQRDLNDP
jgi:GNAT superfamily N-acetyltransferase